jgi:methyl-accepting chemotaxis protein
MEQLTATVKLNAESARQASQLADVASTTASRGGSLVEEVVTTMSGISKARRKLLKSPT